jgi:glycosyltransferase involved in cell wall biosynthesis
MTFAGQSKGISNLFRLLKKMTRQDLPAPEMVPERNYLVITECYSPYAVGGAEVSLALTLGASRESADMLVVNVLGRAPDVTRQRVGGIEVIALPAQAKWPYHRLSATERARIKTELPKVLAWPLFAFHALLYLFSGRLDQIAARWLMLLTHALRIRHNGPFAPVDEEHTGYWSLAIRRIFTASGATAIHGDNLLGVMLAETAGNSETHRIGVVRDNRFLCARRDQQTRIGSGACVTCHAQCHEGAGLADARLRQIARHIGRQRRHALRSCDDVVVTSRYLQRQVEGFGAMPTVTRIANPGSDRPSSLVRAPAEAWAGTNIVVVGQICDNKGQEALAAQLPEMIRRIPDVRLHFAGRGDAARDRMVEAAGPHAHRLRFHGYLDRDAIRALYERCQIAALPTLWPEPFGRIPLEAGLCRRPVVAFDVGGLSEQIVHGVTGYVVAPGDYDGFIAALAVLAKDPALRERLGAAGARHIANRYDLAATTRAYEALWHDDRRRAAQGARGQVALG